LRCQLRAAGVCRKVGALLFNLARRNKAAGLETAAACNRCDAVLWSRAWRSEPCVDRLACLAGANDVRSPVAVCRTTIQPDDRKLARSIMRIKTALLSKLTIRSELSPSCSLLTRQHAATRLGCARVIDSQNFSALETPAPSVQGFFESDCKATAPARGGGERWGQLVFLCSTSEGGLDANAAK
jgi:hypothetical protein